MTREQVDGTIFPLLVVKNGSGIKMSASVKIKNSSERVCKNEEQICVVVCLEVALALLDYNSSGRRLVLAST